VGISTSLFLIAVGAILAYAVDVSAKGVDLHAVGVILMVVGALGALLSIAFWGSWGGFGRRDVVVARGVSRRRVVQDDAL
jgi:hypothetical protein